MCDLSLRLQDSDYVIAERNFVTDDRSMLSFHKGDIIRLQVMDGLEKGETPWYMLKKSCHLIKWIYDLRVFVCVCFLSCVWSPGYSYGCVVRKKVVYLEELKRDTPDFGEYSLNQFILIPNQMSASLPRPKSKQGDNSDWQLWEIYSPRLCLFTLEVWWYLKPRRSRCCDVDGAGSAF